MTPNTDLFDLIKTLTKAEKRNFRLLASQNKRKGSHNSLSLFDELEKQNTYNEDKLRIKFPGKQLASTKYLLYEQLLKSIRHLEEKNHLEAQFDNYLLEVNILLGKGLAKQAAKKLQKAEKLALKYQFSSGLSRIREWKSRLLLFGEQSKENEIITISEPNETCRQLRYVELLGRMRTLHEFSSRKGILCKLNEAHQLMSDPLIKNEHSPKDWRAKSILLELHGLYALLNKKSRQAVAFFRQAIELYDKEKRYLAFKQDYQILVSQSIFSILKGRNDQHAETLIRKLTNKRNNFWLDDQLAETEKSIFHFCSMVHQEKFREAIQFLDEHRESVEAVIERMPESYQIHLAFFEGVACFELQEFDDADNAFHKVNDRDQNGGFPLVHAASKVLDTFIHIEKENFFFLEYQLRSLRRYLKKIQLVGKKETAWLKAISQLIRTTHHKERVQVYSRLEESISRLAGRCLSGIPIGEKAIRSWLSGKLEYSRGNLAKYYNENKKLLADPGEESFSMTA